MKIYVPGYYKDFKCIADSCKKTCCAGWEIDVDEISLKRYENIADINKFVRDGSFVLREDERCPFLLDNGLCSMIIKYGEDMLCDICNDHPRFRNFFEDHIEMGVGLTCEAAARLVIDWEAPFELCVLGEEDTKVLIPDYIESFINRDIDIISRLSDLYASSLTSCERVGIFEDLERLDDKWSDLLASLRNSNITVNQRESYIRDNAIKFEQLAVYFLYRHGNKSFAVECVNLIAELCLNGGDIYEISSMLSSEVEYSDINIDTLLYDVFGEE